MQDIILQIILEVIDIDGKFKIEGEGIWNR
jgi:hypothetical protein